MSSMGKVASLTNLLTLSEGPDSYNSYRHGSGGVKPIVIGVAGGSGSGKTTFARAIYDKFGAENITFITHDSYYKDLQHLTFDQRSEFNFDHPDSLDTSLLVEHIIALTNHKAVRIPTYDYSTHCRLEGLEELSAKPCILIEGILIFTSPELLDLMDVKIFIDTDDDIRLIRRMRRDISERARSMESVIEQYLKTVRPMHHEFVEPSKKKADIVIPEGLNVIALDLVITRLYHHIHFAVKNVN